MTDQTERVREVAQSVVDMWRRGDPGELEHRNWSEFDHAILKLDQALADTPRCTCPWYHHDGECPVHGNP